MERIQIGTGDMAILVDNYGIWMAPICCLQWYFVLVLALVYFIDMMMIDVIFCPNLKNIIGIIMNISVIK
jgi:hypothetical protein